MRSVGHCEQCGCVRGRGISALTTKPHTMAARQRKADEGKVSRLVEMGFDKAAAEQALLACSGDETAALERLLGGA